ENSLVATDDRNTLEYGFARGVGRSGAINLPQELVAYARQDGLDRPLSPLENIDWTRVEAERAAFDSLYTSNPTVHAGESETTKAWREIFRLYELKSSEPAANLIQSKTLEPASPYELEIAAECAALAGHPRSTEWADRLAQ